MSRTLFRIYEPWETGKDGYPHVWHDGLTLCESPDEGLRWAIPKDGFRRDAEGDTVGGPWPWFGDLDTIYEGGIKHLVRAQARHRCIRCLHPYKVGGDGEWSATPDEEIRKTSHKLMPALWDGIDDEDIGIKLVSRTHWSECDARCRHGGPMRAMTTEGWHPFEPTPEACGAAVAALRSDFSNAAVAQAAWRILTVHHLNGNKADLRWWNLTALCQRCHLAVQKRVIMERVFPFEHSDWFKPYAAGWYAYIYLGENLTRAETMDRLDELLALERLA